MVQLPGDEVPLKRSVWTFLFFVLGAVACVSAIPQTDLPETAYNEVDQPVNQAPPVVPGIKFVRPAIAPAVRSRQLGALSRDVFPQEPVTTPAGAGHHSHSLQDLLCTFLI